ncbi:cyclic peptide export ABC transporter [Bacillus infantis]|uniref:Cyclic peptide export ABC transporter n=1 Tax=Bacillus infantis TaxID=324767 RepID=A0A5D4RNS2_9BACI|nr:cyclic peptide export ABC transporter [Bacillus infantis]TYS51132.1 cyclic peptide export ABC transporter [Bacillus infantis]
MKIFKFLFSVSKTNVILAIAAGIISGVSGTLVIALVNNILMMDNPGTLQVVLGFSGLCITMLLSSLVSGYLLIRLAQGSIIELRLDLSKRILSTPLRGLEEKGSHRLLATLTDDVAAIMNAVSVSPMLITNLVIVIGCLGYMGYLSLPVLGIGFGFMLAAFLSYQLMMKFANKYLIQAREKQDELFNHFNALTQGTKELKTNKKRRISFFQNELTPTVHGVYQSTVRGMTLYTFAGNWGQLLFLFFIGFVLFLGPAFSPASSDVLVGYTLAILYMMTPLITILNIMPNFGRANISLKKIDSLSLASEDSVLTEENLERTSYEKLALIGLTHQYYREKEDLNFTLKIESLTFTPGELVFLVGGNGSGKTTLAKMITGLYQPESGSIFLDNKEIRNQDLDYYRQLFSVVFSDFYLFDNLLGVDLEKQEETAQYYLKLLQLDHKVKIEDGKLSTTKLSQGQRKRLALLTAYLEDRPFYVFDEWAADQDPIFKQVFYTQLLQDLKERGKTILVISHDDQYFHLAERMIIVDYGQIVSDERQESNHSKHLVAEY